uniref:transposase n=1 Tax=Rhizobium redzepovicii TaxID=2867518 RepID=UPI0035C71AA9
MAESCEPGVTVCSVARRHGLTPQQLFTWRRLARKPAEVLSVPGEDRMFAPAVVVSPGKPSAQFSALFEGLDWKRVHTPSETRTPVACAVGDRFMGQPQRVRGLQGCGRSRITAAG